MIWFFRIAASVILGLWMMDQSAIAGEPLGANMIKWIVYSLGVFCALMAVHP